MHLIFYKHFNIFFEINYLTSFLKWQPSEGRQVYRSETDEVACSISKTKIYVYYILYYM